MFIWTNVELHSFGYPVLLSNAPYYKPSMTLYLLGILVSAFAYSITQNHTNLKDLITNKFLHGLTQKLIFILKKDKKYLYYLNNEFNNMNYSLGGTTDMLITSIFAYLIEK